MENNTNGVNIGNKGRDAFYAIIAVAVFIVMAIGATFAFFTATARSGDSAVSTGSTTLSLEYTSFGSAWSNDDLIPALTEISEYSVEYQNDTTLGNNLLNGQGVEGVKTNNNNTLCKDDYGNSVCSVYEFQVRNPASSPLTVNLSLVTETNEFTNLRAMAYEVSIDDENDYNSSADGNKTNDPIFKSSADDTTPNAIAVTNASNQEVYDKTPIYINRDGVKKELLSYDSSNNETPVIKPSINLLVSTTPGSITLADNITIEGGEVRTFAIVLYVFNLEEEDQTADDADSTFTGRVVVGNGDGSTGVSGVISAAGGAELQGGE